MTRSISNQTILIDTLSLQEARESSAIENIISTFDDIYQSSSQNDTYISYAVKEEHAYSKALKIGFEMVKKKWNSNNKPYKKNS
ncbi:MAG: Fic/DOC family N-terminal domain-containing protein [Bacteroidota bacterium]